MADKEKTAKAGAVELTEEDLKDAQGGMNEVVELEFKFFRPNPARKKIDPSLKS